jgi:phosphonate transport system substrate-binding protein
MILQELHPQQNPNFIEERKMRKKLLYVVFAALFTLALALTACKPAATTTTTTAEETTAPVVPVEEPTQEVTVGTEANPIEVIFVASVDANVIITGGQLLADALHEATGLYFNVVVPTSYAAAIEEMCASPDNTMGFMPPAGYVLANDRCGVNVSLKAVRHGYSVYWTQILVQRSRTDITSIADLDGKTWGYGDVGSASGYLYPAGEWLTAGITPGAELETGGHPQTVLAVYNGEVDFGTTFFSPPLKPADQPAWAVGDAPDIPDDLVDSCGPEVSGDKTNLMCSGWQVLDARANVVSTNPDVVQKVKILDLVGPIPNDTLSFGPDFPEALRTQIVTALQAFAQSPDWENSLGSVDFYGWTGMDTATDADFDPVRAMIQVAGITIDNIK